MLQEDILSDKHNLIHTLNSLSLMLSFLRLKVDLARIQLILFLWIEAIRVVKIAVKSMDLVLTKKKLDDRVEIKSIL